MTAPRTVQKRLPVIMQILYPTIIKAVNKENGGHGDAVNAGLAHATGRYFKVVDSDDWVDEEALRQILEAVRGFVQTETEVDMIVSNYVYERLGLSIRRSSITAMCCRRTRYSIGTISGISGWTSIS